MFLFTVLVIHLFVLLSLLLTLLPSFSLLFYTPFFLLSFPLFIFHLFSLIQLISQIPGHEFLLLSIHDFRERVGFFGTGGNRLESHLAAKQITSPTLLISAGVPCLVFILPSL